MAEKGISFNPPRLIELVIAVFVGGISNKLFDIYWTVPDFQSRITVSVIITLTVFGLVALLYSVVWLTQYPFRLRKRKTGSTDKQEADKQEHNELPNSIILRNEFKHRKFELN